MVSIRWGRQYKHSSDNLVLEANLAHFAMVTHSAMGQDLKEHVSQTKIPPQILCKDWGEVFKGAPRSPAHG